MKKKLKKNLILRVVYLSEIKTLKYGKLDFMNPASHVNVSMFFFRMIMAIYMNLNNVYHIMKKHGI